jgi:hypothetical protein
MNSTAITTPPVIRPAALQVGGAGTRSDRSIRQSAAKCDIAGRNNDSRVEFPTVGEIALVGGSKCPLLAAAQNEEWNNVRNNADLTLVSPLN